MEIFMGTILTNAAVESNTHSGDKQALGPWNRYFDGKKEVLSGNNVQDAAYKHS